MQNLNSRMLNLKYKAQRPPNRVFSTRFNPTEDALVRCSRIRSTFVHCVGPTKTQASMGIHITRTRMEEWVSARRFGLGCTAQKEDHHARCRRLGEASTSTLVFALSDEPRSTVQLSARARRPVVV